MTHQPFVLSIMSRDRVGIVRDVSAAVRDLHGDIADLSQTVLRGYFTMILLVTFPGDVGETQIVDALARLSEGATSPLKISVLSADDIAPAPTAAPTDSYVITARGADRIGFVATVADFCAENALNIIDLATMVDGDDYVMILQIELGVVEVDDVRRGLVDFRRETGMDVVLQHHDIVQAMNEIALV